MKMHRGVTEGKRVLVITRKGEYIESRFLGTRGDTVLLESRSIQYKHIRSLTILRAQAKRT
jgi:hypothetical protein